MFGLGTAPGAMSAMRRRLTTAGTAAPREGAHIIPARPAKPQVGDTRTGRGAACGMARGREHIGFVCVPETGAHHVCDRATTGEGALTQERSDDAIARAIRVPDAPITLSTASVYPEKVPA